LGGIKENSKGKGGEDASKEERSKQVRTIMVNTDCTRWATKEESGLAPQDINLEQSRDQNMVNIAGM